MPPGKPFLEQLAAQLENLRSIAHLCPSHVGICRSEESDNYHRQRQDLLGTQTISVKEVPLVDSVTGIAVFTHSSPRSGRFLVHVKKTSQPEIVIFNSRGYPPRLSNVLGDTDDGVIFPGQRQGKGKKRKSFMFSQRRKSSSIVLAGSSLPGCQLLLFLVSLIQRSLALVRDQMSDGAFFSCEICKFKFLEFGCHLSSKENLAQSLPRRLKGSLCFQ